MIVQHNDQDPLQSPLDVPRDSVVVIDFLDAPTRQLASPECKFPPYAEDPSIIPMTALQNGRYDCTMIISTDTMVVSPGIHSTASPQEPIYLPNGWTEHVNPEGAPFYTSSAAEMGSFCIVTDVPLHEQRLYEKLVASIEKIKLLAERLQFRLPNDCELYIQVNEADDRCKYYLVDHNSKTEFWLQKIDSDVLEMPELSSSNHLKFVLQEHYWTHVEYFPHRPVAPQDREELVNILRHAAIDQLTSESSTFPYAAEQCGKFLTLVDVQTASSPYMTSAIARLWVTVARYRFSNYYGEKHARLGRLQQRLGKSVATSSLMMKICSILLFEIPKRITTDLDMLFVDRIAYAMHWQKYMTQQMRFWRESSYLSACLLMANVGFLTFVGTSIGAVVSLISLITPLGAMTSGVVLLNLYANGENMNAATVAQHMSDIEHDKLGFQPISAVLSLPEALLLWSLNLFALNILVAAAETPSILMKTVITAILFCAGLVWLKARNVSRG